MRYLFGGALLVMVSCNCWAQEPDPNDVPQDVPQVEAPATAAHAQHKIADKKFWLLGAALNASMVLDTKSTFDVTNRCSRCVEADPFAAPFINRGPLVAFTAAEAFDVGVMALAGKMRQSSRSPLRHTWWLIPAALAAGHLVAYHHNITPLR